MDVTPLPQGSRTMCRKGGKRLRSQIRENQNQTESTRLVRTAVLMKPCCCSCQMNLVNNSSVVWEKVQEPLYLAEELRVVDGGFRRDNLSSLRVWLLAVEHTPVPRSQKTGFHDLLNFVKGGHGVGGIQGCEGRSGRNQGEELRVTAIEIECVTFSNNH